MTSFGICTIYKSVGQLSYEQQKIYEEAQKQYDRVLLINPRLVNYMFLRSENKPIILYNNEDIADLNSLMIRSTKNSEAAIAILARALKGCGCIMLDPLERFSVGKSSKLLTTLSRFQKGIGTSSYISFTRTGSLELLKRLNSEKQLPLLTKPIDGKRGRGIAVIPDLQTGIECINNYFGDEEYNPDPFYMQEYVNFQKEYRVLVLDGKSIGVVEKLKSPDKVMANAAQGATFVAVDAPEIVAAVLENVSSQGLLGVDVAIDQHNTIHIIETNRSPQWQTFENATGINVAEIIISHTLKQPISYE